MMTKCFRLEKQHQKVVIELLEENCYLTKMKSGWQYSDEIINFLEVGHGWLRNNDDMEAYAVDDTCWHILRHWSSADQQPVKTD